MTIAAAVVVALLSAPALAQASQDAAFKDIDAALSRLQAAIERPRLGECAALIPAEGKHQDPTRERIDYQACRALVSSDPSQCSAENPPPNVTRECLDTYGGYLMARLLITRSAAAKKDCEKMPVPANWSLPGGMPKFCADLAEQRDAAGLCALVGRVSGEKQGPQCAAESGRLFGRRGSCAALEGAGAAECNDFASFRESHAAGSVAKCGSSTGCRMLMGADVCGSYLKRYCTAIVRSRLTEVDAMINAFEPKSGQGYARRRERFRVLRDGLVPPARQKPARTTKSGS